MFCVSGRNSKWSYVDIIKVEVKVTIGIKNALITSGNKHIFPLKYHFSWALQCVNTVCMFTEF